MSKIEIFRHGRYERCAVIYWPEEMKKPDYIIVLDSKGREVICHLAMGAWCELNSTDIISRLRWLESQSSVAA